MVNKTISLFLFFALVIIGGCSTPQTKKKSKNRHSHRDLKEIKKEGKLKVLTTYSSTSYFLYRGETMGYEYEMLQQFADYLGIKPEIKISQNIDGLLDDLNNGDVDLVAHGITITNERKEKVHFTDYLYLTHQVLVQKKPDNWRKIGWSKLQKSLIHDAIELIGDTVSVRKNSSYMHRLVNLSNEIGGKIYIDTLPGNLSTNKIIEMVANGKIKYTVADNNLASINASYYPILDISVPISFSQRVAWAVRSDSPELEKAINNWLHEFKKSVDYYVIYNKYFKNNRSFKARGRSDYLSLNTNKISKYDNLIKTYAKKIGWDWRLLAAQIYQESNFDPHKKSWAGAHGLMQIMPSTAKAFSVKNKSNPEENIKGGINYLKNISGKFESVKDSVQRIKFTLAAYNCGYHHIFDAQKLAKEENLKADVWDNNVEKAILKLSYRENYSKPFIKYGYVRGQEPYNYVRQIFDRYENYKQFIE